MKKRSTKWHGVIVVLHGTSCAAAALCRTKRFLSTDAPRLPLPDCQNRGECQCVYKHFDDRRTTPRRTADMSGSLASERAMASNRRKSRGRRAHDKN